MTSTKANALLTEWIAQHTAFSAQQLAKAISATNLCRERPEFGQCLTPARGSVLASRVIANWNPEPDYFFHWVRDAAIAMRAVVDMVALSKTARERTQWQRCFHDMVQFSLTLTEASKVKQAPEDYRNRTIKSCRRFLRSRAQLNTLRDDKLLAEPRFNPDGSVDVLRWSRPQLDGPALRALACLAWLNQGGELTSQLKQLVQRDLAFTCKQAGKRSIGPWEEPQEYGHHYHVALVQLGALVQGRRFAGKNTARWQRAERKLRKLLEQHWLPKQKVFCALLPMNDATKRSKQSAAQAVDAAIVLAIVEADLPDAQHSVLDPRAASTLAVLEQAFIKAFPINRKRPRNLPPALGRSLADRYFGGGAWYATTLGAAAFCYRHALADAATATEWLHRGDQYLRTVKWMLPTDGAMAEQVDRATKKPRSAQHLTWSYAAFISAVRLRQQAVALLDSKEFY